jgi:hypothetical protein
VVRRRLVRRPLAPVSAPRARLRHRWLYAALAGLALTGSIVLPALPAAADTGTITFNSVSGDGSGNLAVTVTSDDPLSSITVYLWPGVPDTGTAALTSSDFTEQGTFSAGVPQIWTLSTPSTDLSTLPPGTYTATAIATDADLDQTTPADQVLTGAFNFQIVPSISLSQATVSSTAPGQDVNITGQLTAVQPLGISPTAWSGQTVTITDSSSTTWTGTSGTNGSFSIPVTGTPNDQYTASVAATAANLGATSPTSTTDVAQFATTSISAAATSAPYGQQSITGTLTYQSGLSQVAAPGGVQITAMADGQQPVSTTTSGNGSFSMMLPAVTGTTIWNLTSQANDLATSPFLAGTTTSISAVQTWPATLGGFSATLSKYYVLTVGGCLSSSLDPAPPPDFPTIQIQYELTTAGPWRELGTVSTTQMTGCAGAAFLAQGGAPAAGAYYRAYFPGDETYQPASGIGVKAALIATRFDPFQASARTLASPAKKVTISGTLQYRGRKWTGYARQRVLLIYSKNNKSWYAYHWLRTNNKGAFSSTFADAVGTAYWSANYNGNGTHLVAGAPEVKVTVRHWHARVTGGPGQQPQPVTAFFTTGPSGGSQRSSSWHTGIGWPFLMAADPLLILMGVQPQP